MQPCEIDRLFLFALGAVLLEAVELEEFRGFLRLAGQRNHLESLKK